MTRKPRRRRTPAEITADLEAARLKQAHQRAAERLAGKDPATWGRDAEQAALPANEDIREAAQGKLRAFKRFDIFDSLHDGREISLAALLSVQALERDIRVRALEGERGGEIAHSAFGSRDLVSIRSLEAGNRIARARAIIGDRKMLMLSELIVPDKVHAMVANRWRLVVARYAFVTSHAAQRKAVALACEELNRADQEVGLGRAP